MGVWGRSCSRLLASHDRLCLIRTARWRAWPTRLAPSRPLSAARCRPSQSSPDGLGGKRIISIVALASANRSFSSFRCSIRLATTAALNGVDAQIEQNSCGDGGAMNPPQMMQSRPIPISFVPRAPSTQSAPRPREPAGYPECSRRHEVIDKQGSQHHAQHHDSCDDIFSPRWSG